MLEPPVDPIAHFRSVRTQSQQDRTNIMERVRGTYFHHPMHEEALEFIDDLIGLIVEERNPKAGNHSALAHELQGFAVIGEPRAGKSTLLRRIFQKHPAFPRYGIVGSGCPLITIIPEGACTLPRFAIDALRKLGMPAQTVPRDEKQLAHLVRDHMRLMGVKILHIDEAHHITQPANETHRLTPEDFARAYARKTAAEAEDNPFIADDWESIRFRAPLDEEAAEDAPVKRKRGRPLGSRNKGN